MAISKIKKVEILGLEKDKEALLSILQKLGVIQLISVQPITVIAQTPYSDANLLEIEEAISFLASFKEKASFLQGIVKLKPVVYPKQLQEVISDFDYRSMLKELSNLRNHLRDLLQHKERLSQERQLLLPWRKLQISLEDIHYQQHCGIILGILNIHDHQNLLQDFEKNNINLFIDIVDKDEANIHLAILYLVEDFGQLEALLKSYNFNFATLPRHKCTTEERLLGINTEIIILDNQIQEIRFKIANFAEQQFKLMLVYDYLYNMGKAEEAESFLVKQQFSFILSGWIRQKEENLLTQVIPERFKDVAIFISEPGGNEDIPVILENKPLLQPFEVITNMYGMPKYSELDPTPFLAPFFFLYFGFCFSDVGYGIILILLSWFVLKKFKMGPQGQRFWKLFLYCGISTILVGMLTGSWFGNLFDLLGETNKVILALKRFKDSVVILEPLKEPTKLLGIALIFGVIQVWFGNIIAAIGNIKNKHYLDVVLDQLPRLTFLFGLTGWGMIFLQLLTKSYINVFKYSLLTSAITLLLTQGRSEKGWGSKLFYGAYNLYNAFSGYLSDILSYSRLWALGLVTGVMANTINLISIEFSKILLVILPFLERIAFLKIIVSSLILISIFVAGHMVSFSMNLLGAFVHPLRLQFVEFFSKFFKSGGSSFKPFKIETRYIEMS